MWANEGYRRFAPEIAEQMGCSEELVCGVITDLVASGILPKSKGRSVVPVTQDGLRALAFAVAARASGMSKPAMRQVVLAWDCRSRPNGLAKSDRSPFGICEISINHDVLRSIEGLAQGEDGQCSSQ